MEIGLLGFPQSGKRTLLRLLTGVDAHTAATGAGGTVPGVCPVRDPRVERLAAMYRPKKVTPAIIRYLLMPDVTKDSTKNHALLTALALVDVLALVVRAFADETVFHVEGSVAPLRDLDALQAELLLHDLLFLDTRLERLAKETGRRAGVDRSKEHALLTKLHAHLNEPHPLRTLAISRDEAQLLSGAPLLTRKPLVLILNVGEDAVRDRRLAEEVERRAGGREVRVVQVSAKVEDELGQLDAPDERAAFLRELGVTESAIDGLTRVSYEALGLISYFTVGPDEVRAWTVPRGASAAQAAGVIHSDLERGFIRAERITYDDLMALGSEQAVAGAGKLQLKGKEYLVEDGDILNFRFSV